MPHVTARPTAAREHPYRSFLTFHSASGALERVLDQLGVWLREKGWDVDLTAVGFHRRQDHELLVVRQDTDRVRDFRARLVEPAGGCAWRTELTVRAPDRGEGWLLLDVSNNSGRFVQVPCLARYLIQAMDVRDGGEQRLTDSPTIITSGRVEELAEVVCDPDRHGLVFVAGTDHRLPFDPFVAEVGRWTEQVLGQAEAVVLDPVATRRFSKAMGETHGVRPWTLRTFRPDVDPAQTGDALRHRFLTTERLALTEDAETVRLLGRIARGHAAARTLPAVVTAATHALTRVETSYVIDAIGGTQQDAGTAGGTDIGAARTEARVRGPMPGLTPGLTPGLAERPGPALSAPPARADAVALDRVTSKLHRQQELIELLQAEKQVLQDALGDEQLEHAITDEARTELADEARWLRKRLRELQDYDGAFAPLPDSEVIKYPYNYAELLRRLPDLAELGVVFTGDHKECVQLDEADSLGRTARAAWESLLVLGDYLRARRDGAWNGGVDAYLTQTPAGYRTVSARRHASTESGATMRQFGRQRVFPVPADVAPGGMAVMTAHFRLGRIATISPRLYYLDDHPRTGRIYVGYIGEHPTNTKTT